MKKKRQKVKNWKKKKIINRNKEKKRQKRKAIPNAQVLEVFNLDFISLIFILSRSLAKYRTIDYDWSTWLQAGHTEFGVAAAG